MNLTFNVIFTPGTVRYLKLAALSLVKYSPYRYRLVSNGLDAAEAAELVGVCRSNDSLEFYVYTPSCKESEIASHGEVLSALERENADEFFCFMDSDIFATGPFHEELERELASCDVLSSCRQIMVEPGEQVRGYIGRCTETPEGYALATTFFAVYKSAPLKKVIRETDVSFERYEQSDALSERASFLLRELGVKHAKFDTGKLLNVLSHAFGVKYRYRDFDNLNHLGGFSGTIKKRRNVHWLKINAMRALAAIGVEKCKKKVSNFDRRRMEPRRRAGTFFIDYFNWLDNCGKKPRWKPLDDKDAEIGRRVEALCETIKALHASLVLADDFACVRAPRKSGLEK